MTDSESQLERSIEVQLQSLTNSLTNLLETIDLLPRLSESLLKKVSQTQELLEAFTEEESGLISKNQSIYNGIATRYEHILSSIAAEVEHLKATVEESTKVGGKFSEEIGNIDIRNQGIITKYSESLAEINGQIGRLSEIADKSFEANARTAKLVDDIQAKNEDLLVKLDVKLSVVDEGISNLSTLADENSKVSGARKIWMAAVVSSVLSSVLVGSSCVLYMQSILPEVDQPTPSQ